MTEYYGEKLKKGQEYQDFISDELRKRGIILGVYSSQKYQKEKGESCSGIEIKHDMRMAETQNIYIETEEKPDKLCPKWSPGSIYRDKKSWGLIIGDYDRAFLFSIKQLRHVCGRSDAELAKDGIRRVETETSKAVLLPIETYVKKTTIALLSFDFKEMVD